MKNKDIKLLILASLTLIVIAGVIISSRPNTTQERPLLFPNLPLQIDDVAKIKIKSYTNTLSLSRRDQEWGIDEFDGYPALPEKIKATVIGMAELRVIAPKTSKQALYHRLGVAGIETEDSPSLRLDLEDDQGEMLASLLVGLPRISKAAENRPGRYVRLPGDPQSYLVEGLLDISAQKADWFEQTLFDIPPSDIKQITVHHSDGDQYSLYKEVPAQDNFALTPVPKGKAPVSTIILNRPGALMQNFYVQAAYQSDRFPSGVNFTEIAVSTFKGLVIDIQAFKHEETAYARFTFSHDFAEETVDEQDQATVIAQRQRLEKQLSAWLFAIPEHKYDLMARRSSSLLKEGSPDQAGDQ